MKEKINKIVYTFATIVVIYLVSSFVGWSFSIVDWPPWNRALFLFFSFVGACAAWDINSKESNFQDF